MSPTNVPISYVLGTATDCVWESEDSMAKQVGAEACKQVVGAEACKQVVGAEEDKVVISADDIATQVRSEGNHTNVGRMDRWKRVANGKG